MQDLKDLTVCIQCPVSSLRGICSEEEFRLINSNRSEMEFSEGEVIIRQGTYVSQVVFIKKGILKVVLEGKNDRRTILQLVESNNFVGLPVVGNPDIYPFTIVAVTNADVCFIKNDILADIMSKSISASKFILKWFTDDYLYLYSRIATISTRNNHGKLASALLYLTNGNFKSDILNIISRKDLAELASVSLESLNKILTELRNDKIIEIRNKKIKILKPELIQKLSTVG